MPISLSWATPSQSLGQHLGPGDVAGDGADAAGVRARNEIEVEPLTVLAALAGLAVGARRDVAVVVAVVLAPAGLQRRPAVAEQVVHRAQARRVVGTEVDQPFLFFDEARRREPSGGHAAFIHAGLDPVDAHTRD